MRLMKILLTIVIMLSNFVFLPTGNTGSFKLIKVGEHKLTIALSDDFSKDIEYSVNNKNILEVDGSSKRLLFTDLVSGKRIWEKEMPEPLVHHVTFDNSYVYLDNYPHIISDLQIKPQNLLDSGRSFSFFCIDSKNGKTVWQQNNGSFNKPVFIGERMFLGHTNFENDLFETSYKCLDKATGKLVWQKLTNKEIGFQNYIGKEGNRLGREIKNGLRTKTRLGSENKTDVFVIGYISSPWSSTSTTLYSFNVSTGKMNWKTENLNNNTTMMPYDEGLQFKGERFISVALDKQQAYILSIEGKLSDSEKLVLHCLNVQNGKRIWKSDVIRKFNDYYYDGEVEIGNSYVLVNKWLFSKKTGQLIKTLQTTSHVFQSEIQNHVYIVNYKGIEAINPLTSKRIWYKPIILSNKNNINKTDAQNQLLEQDKKLFILTDQGLACIDATNGKTLDSWNYKVTPKSVFSAGKNLVACEIVNTEGSPTVLLFEY